MKKIGLIRPSLIVLTVATTVLCGTVNAQLQLHFTPIQPITPVEPVKPARPVKPVKPVKPVLGAGNVKAQSQKRTVHDSGKRNESSSKVQREYREVTCIEKGMRCKCKCECE